MKKTLIIAALIFVLPLVVYRVMLNSRPAVSETAEASVGMPKVIKFSSPMCSDCQKLAETLDEIDDEYDDRVDFVAQANYKEGSELDKLVKDVIAEIALKDKLVRKNLKQKK